MHCCFHLHDEIKCWIVQSALCKKTRSMLDFLSSTNCQIVNFIQSPYIVSVVLFHLSWFAFQVHLEASGRRQQLLLHQGPILALLLPPTPQVSSSCQFFTESGADPLFVASYIYVHFRAEIPALPFGSLSVTCWLYLLQSQTVCSNTK